MNQVDTHNVFFSDLTRQDAVNMIVNCPAIDLLMCIVDCPEWLIEYLPEIKARVEVLKNLPG